MKVRAWLISQGTDGVGSRGIISRAAWADVARAAADGMAFDDYDPAVPGKVSKPSKEPRPVAQAPEIVKPTYRVKSLPVVRPNKTAYTYLDKSGGTVLAFDLCSQCVNHISRCPCSGGPVPPKFSTGEVLWERPVA